MACSDFYVLCASVANLSPILLNSLFSANPLACLITPYFDRDPTFILSAQKRNLGFARRCPHTYRRLSQRSRLDAVQLEPIEHARKVASQLRTGNVHLNGAGVDLNAPFGGYKQSGTGREWGEFGFEEFLEIKAVMGYAA